MFAHSVGTSLLDYMVRLHSVTVSVTCDWMLNPTVGPPGVVTREFNVLSPALLLSTM